MMRMTLPSQSPSSFLSASSELYSAAPGNTGAPRRSRSRLCFIVCVIPARDVVIHFGKFQGSRMGTLPRSYLRWLINEGSQPGLPGLAAWADYAQQVLQDPHYQDRLEWERIEKLSVRGDLRRGDAPTGNASVKATMLALGWDLSDRDGWYQVNFSLLGTSLGGRIPRKKPADSSVSGAGIIVPPSISSSASPRMSAMKAGADCTLSNHKQPSSASVSSASRTSTMKAYLTGRNPTVSNLKQPSSASPTFAPTTKASLTGQNTTISNLKQPSSATYPSISSKMSVPPSTTSPPKNPVAKSSLIDDSADKQDPNVKPPSRSLQEELHRRRLLRKERSTSKSLNKLLSGAGKGNASFPGRESLLERAKFRADK